MTAFLARRQHFDRVGSTNDVVRGWLANDTPEVCLAVAAEQTNGRGRAGRRWVAPPGGALLLSLGFRPHWLPPADVWRLAAVVSLAMAEAGEAVAGLSVGTIRLKWPNDLVIESMPAIDSPAVIRKLAGVLGETDGLGTASPRAVVGIGINTDWAAEAFLPELARSMTSLRVAADGRPVDDAALLEAFIDRLEPRVDALRSDGAFDAETWSERQVTTDREIRLDRPDGPITVRATGVDPASGALLVVDPGAPGRSRSVFVGEVSHVRFADPTMVGV